MDETLSKSIALAAAAIRDAPALLIAAGAGMGVDSGLPDFRGPEGFWAAYPPYRKLGLRFEQIANPMHFDLDPHLAWGFYGHRLHLYRNTKPHIGYAILRDSAASMPGGSFVFTSNVDGQFAAAGFLPQNIVECHGSIHHFQCAQPCDDSIWSADHTDVEVDPESMRAIDPLPKCPRCGAIARPNILMFGDGQWLSNRTDVADAAFSDWYNRLAAQTLCVIELGAGTAIPTVRLQSERIARKNGGTLIRINVRDPVVPPNQISIPLPAAEAIQLILSAMQLQ
jgi:NAD-dependent SIR2 family protein deacetylase